MLRAFAAFAVAALAVAVLAGGCAVTDVRSPAEARGQLAPGGTLRAAINFGNPVLAQRDPRTREPRGVSVELAREAARRLGVPVTFVEYEAAGRVSAAARSGAWDIAFLAVDPERAVDIDFTAPYVVIEGAYAVPADSPVRSNAEVDRDGVRIAVGARSAYDLFLTREIKRARIVRAPTSPAAVEMFMKDRLEVLANVKQPLERFVRETPSVRLLPGAFMTIEQAMGTPTGRPQALAWLREYVEEMKASGRIERWLKESGQLDAAVAPPARPRR